MYTKQLNKTIMYIKANIDNYNCIGRNKKNEKQKDKRNNTK